MSVSAEQLRAWVEKLDDLDFYGARANEQVRILNVVLGEMRDAADALDNEPDREGCHGDGD